MRHCSLADVRSRNIQSIANHLWGPMKGRKIGMTAGATSRMEEKVFSMMAPRTCEARLAEAAEVGSAYLTAGERLAPTHRRRAASAVAGLHTSFPLEAMRSMATAPPSERPNTMILSLRMWDSSATSCWDAGNRVTVPIPDVSLAC